MRFRGSFAYIDGQLPDGDTLHLMRLRYGGSASRWGFAIYLASKDSYPDQILPTGFTAGTPEEALDCAAGLYLDHTTTSGYSYQDQILPTGFTAGTPEEALDCAAGLYLDHTTTSG